MSVSVHGTHIHTCQCLTCYKNRISREQQLYPEHQQLYIIHTIFIRLQVYSNFNLVVSLLTTTSMDVIFLNFAPLIFPYFIMPVSLKHSYSPLHHAAPTVGTLLTNLKVKRYFRETPFTSCCILQAPSVTSMSFKLNPLEVCGPLGLLGRGLQHLCK